MTNEVGRELKVSELKERTVVVVSKHQCPTIATMWVFQVQPLTVTFAMFADEETTLLTVLRCGPDREKITDDSGIPIYVYEFLGEV